MAGENESIENIEALSESELDTLYEESSNEPNDEVPAVAEEPAAAVVQEEEPEVEKVVPLAALHEERMRRKELADQLGRQEERFQQFLDRNRPAAEPPPPIPSVTDNPVQNLDQRIAQVERAQIETNQYTEAQKQQAAANQQEQQFMNQYQMQAAEFAQTEENFAPAYDFWTASRQTELMAGGATQEQATHIARQEEAAIVLNAMQSGENPAERVYAVAKTRGYKPAKPVTGQVETIAQGQKRGRTMPAGGKGPAAISLEAFAAMDDDAFSSISDSDWNKLMGTS
jgi:hypothetical protein